MKETKFRGKKINDDKWVYGFYFRIKDIFVIFPCDQIVASTYTLKNAINKSLDYDEFIEIEYESLSQYTGLKDKNGKEIYEGDIVKFSFIATMGIDKGKSCENLEEVYWSNDESGFRPMVVFSMNGFSANNNLEITGNLYENPELLKGGD